MHPADVAGDARLLAWRRVRKYAVPQSMIETAATRRLVGDWAGACAAARVDVDVDLRALRSRYGTGLATAVRTDLRFLAPDLLRWHMPRVLPDGLLRPDLTVTLVRYTLPDGARAHLVVRTPPAWASGPQRMALTWWHAGTPHGPRPDPRFRLDLHRHLWDARRAAQLVERSGRPRDDGDPVDAPDRGAVAVVPHDWAVDRWSAEAGILAAADGAPGRGVLVRLGRRRLLLRPVPTGPGWGFDARELARLVTGAASSGTRRNRPEAPGGVAVLPDAATWVPPDLLLLRAGMIGPGDLHPLVAEALAPGSARKPVPDPAPGTRLVACRGAVHQLAVVDGVLTALDHDREELLREELLAVLGGTPLPCVAVIDQLHRAPSSLDDVRARLDHGDVHSAVSLVETLLGAEAVLRAGGLQDELAAAAAGRVAYGVHRAGLVAAMLEPDPLPTYGGRPRSDLAFRADLAGPRTRRTRRERRLLAMSR